MTPGAAIWVYSNGSYYSGHVTAIGLKRIAVSYLNGSGKECTKAVAADATVSGYRVLVLGTEPKPAGARSGGKPNAPAMSENRRRVADRIDGYDRDDLGESPDY